MRLQDSITHCSIFKKLRRGIHADCCARSLDEFGIGVVGDLHLEPGQMHLFDNAASQIKAALSGIGNGSRLVQLGDVGGYNHKPGPFLTSDKPIKGIKGNRALASLSRQKTCWLKLISSFKFVAKNAVRLIMVRVTHQTLRAFSFTFHLQWAAQLHLFLCT